MNKPEVKKRYYTQMMDTYRRYPVYIPGLNPLIRFTFSKKAENDIRKILELYEGKDVEVNDWFKSHQLFFGFAVFRSGTTFLADFLNTNLANSIVQHEANVNDYLYYARALQNENDAYIYIKEYRLKEIYHRISPYSPTNPQSLIPNPQSPIPIYGEINPFLRRHSKAIKELLPQAKQFHLVRDGRDVLRSLMSRELFDVNDPMATLIFPNMEDAYFKEWKSMSRFEKLCWLWQCDNEYLRKNISHLIQFEQLSTDYDYFKTNLMDYLAIGNISADVWKEGMQKVNNETPVYRFPVYKDWSNKDNAAFERICGEEMSKCGYAY